MIRNTTTPQAAPADIREATAPLGNAGAILETLARSFSSDEPELSATLQVALRELYAGRERCEQLDMDTRKAQARAPIASREFPAAVARIAALLDALATHATGSTERRAACAELNTLVCSIEGKFGEFVTECYDAMGDDGPAEQEAAE